VDTGGNYHDWVSACWAVDDDTSFSLHKISSTHVKADHTGGGIHCS
jgi:hypothetical protein